MLDLATYSLALAITLGVEIPIARACVARRERPGVTRMALLLNLFTHPLANLAHWEGLLPFLAIEALVMITEALGYFVLAGVPLRRAILVSAIANAVTAAGSLLFL